MITCICLVCGCEWSYKDGTDEDLIRASSSPCGHQGLFEVKHTEETMCKCNQCLLHGREGCPRADAEEKVLSQKKALSK